MLLSEIKPRLLERISKVIYHGTSIEKRAQSILKQGSLIPGTKGPSNMQPMQGRTYFTTDLRYAMIYALGANMIGDDIGDASKWLLDDGEYGYVFVGDNNKIKNHLPDEDVVGELTYKLIKNDETHEFNSEEVDTIKELVDDAFMHIESDEEDDDAYYTPYDKFLNAEYEYFAAVGKEILQNAPPRIIIKYRRLASHFSHKGEIPILSVYRFKKIDSVKLKKDGSNFFQFATKIKGI